MSDLRVGSGGSVKMVAAVAGLLVAVALMMPSASFASYTIGTVESWNGVSNVIYFGDPNTATYGQVVSVPTGHTALTSFTFYLEIPTDVTFRPYVYEWNGSAATGAPVFSGPAMHTNTDSEFEAITINTHNARVTAGHKYVLFFSIAEEEAVDTAEGQGSWGYGIPSSVYPGGEFVFINNGFDPGAWTQDTWTGDWEGVHDSLAFKAVFNGSAPPPSDEYVAMGDSYASGEGSFSYLSEKGSCYRATEGYAEQLAAATGYSLDFAACGGSTIGNLIEGGKAQIRGVGADTKLITLSVGGDDVGFSHVLESCIGGFKSKGGPGCGERDESDAQTALGWLETGRAPGTYNLPGIKSGTSSATPTTKNKVRLPGLSELYEEIVDAAAPGAHLIVVGYPYLMESEPSYGIGSYSSCQVGTLLGVFKYKIVESDIEWIDARTAELDEIIEEAVDAAAAHTGADITYVDPRLPFLGGSICDGAEYDLINALLFATSKFKDKPESFHPTQAGQNILASLIKGAFSGGGGGVVSDDAPAGASSTSAPAATAP